MYKMMHNRPDLAHVVSVVNNFMTDLECAYWEVVKWVLKYLNGRYLWYGVLMVY